MICPACKMVAWKKGRGLDRKTCEIQRYRRQFLTRPRLLLDIHYGGSGGDDKTRVTRWINGEQVGLYLACHPERHILRQISDELDVSIYTPLIVDRYGWDPRVDGQLQTTRTTAYKSSLSDVEIAARHSPHTDRAEGNNSWKASD